MNELLVLGLSHKTAPVAVRERLSATERQTEQILTQLVARDAVHEAAMLSTCNRTEIYLVVSDPVQAESDVLGLVAANSRIRPTELASLVYTPRNCDAARHLYRVASGLDSMVLGEYEVQGQVKRAYDTALRLGTTGPLLNRLFKAALRTGKRVRTETRIAERRTSVSSVAVDLAAETVGDLQDSNAMIIGAGETAELTAQAFATQGVRTLFVSNRHADRARSLAERFGGHVGRLDDLPEQLESADIVVSSTGSPHPVLGPDALGDVMAARRAGGNPRPLVLIDIAVPRDIDAECATIDGVTLLDIDDLQSAVAMNLAGRLDEVEGAERIVEEEIHRFARWMGQLEVTPTISDLRTRASQVVAGVLGENAGRWESASDADLERIERVAQTVVQRLLHEPTVRLKQARDRDDSHGHVELLRELFGLDDAVAAEQQPNVAAAAIGSHVRPAHVVPPGTAWRPGASSSPGNVLPLTPRRARPSSS